jgi:hypothetical protein
MRTLIAIAITATFALVTNANAGMAGNGGRSSGPSAHHGPSNGGSHASHSSGGTGAASGVGGGAASSGKTAGHESHHWHGSR